MQQRLGWAFLAVAAIGLALVAMPGACQLRERGAPAEPAPRQAPAPAPAVARTPPPATPTAPATATQPPTRQLPPIDGEPTVAVLLQRSGQVALQLLRPGRSSDGRRLPAGRLLAAASGGQVLLSGRRSAGPVRVGFAGEGASFRLGTTTYAGDLRLAVLDRQLVVLEELPMERYLTGVLAKEVEPDWPLESLKAQAVAARSYATARWLTRHDQVWQLDASEQVDMAYAGFVAQPHARLATAMAQTRGDLLWFADQPLPAFFYAASGGHTESLAAVWPERTCPDGRTSPAPAMPARPDPWDREGRAVAPRRLGAWRCDLPLRTVRIRLHNAGRTTVGPIADIRLLAKDPASGRARRLRINWGAEHLDLSAHAFRMAMGSTKVKSTLWRDFRIAGDTLVVQGHGYGHGVGLAQASAWAMARAGHSAAEILGFFYSGADLVRKW